MATALIVAAGRGERLGASGPKAFVPLAGIPMIGWSLKAFRASPRIESIVVAVPPGWEPASPAESELLDGVVVCEGGAERSISVRNALDASGAGHASEAVLVHDAARPLVTPELIDRMIESVSRDGTCEAAVAAALVTDTIRVVDADGNAVATPDRATLRAVQTPQAFRRQTLARALSLDLEKLAAATDDAGLVEALGVSVKLIEAPAENFKVTNPTDIRLAELLLADRAGA